MAIAVLIWQPMLQELFLLKDHSFWFAEIGGDEMNNKERLALSDRVRKRIQKVLPTYRFIVERDEIEKSLKKLASPNRLDFHVATHD